MSKKASIDAAEFERLVAEGQNLNKCAKALGVSFTTLINRKNTDTEIKAAYDRGVARRNSGQPAPASARQPVTAQPQTSDGMVIEAIRAGENSRVRIARHTSLPSGQVEKILYRLKFESRQIESVEKNSIEYFFIVGEEPKIPPFIGAETTSLPPPPAPSHTRVEKKAVEPPPSSEVELEIEPSIPAPQAEPVVAEIAPSTHTALAVTTQHSRPRAQIAKRTGSIRTRAKSMPPPRNFSAAACAASRYPGGDWQGYRGGTRRTALPEVLGRAESETSTGFDGARARARSYIGVRICRAGGR